MPVDAHAEMRIGALQFLVLRLGGMDVAGCLAQLFARERARRHVPEVSAEPSSTSVSGSVSF